MTGGGLMALVCGLSPCEGRNTGCSCASLLPGLGFDTLRLGLEMFVDSTQTNKPRGHPDLGAGGSFLCFSLSGELGVPDPD